MDPTGASHGGGILNQFCQRWSPK